MLFRSGRPGHPHGWRAEFQDRARGIPVVIALRSVQERGSESFALRLSLSEVELNPMLDDAVFAARVPASVDRVTLDDVRRNGLFAEEPAHGR